MAAIASVFHGLLKPGDRVLLPSDGYYTVRVFAEKYLAPLGMIVDQVPTAETAARALDGYRLVWVETPSNPGLDLADIAAIARRAKVAGAVLVVDNTTMTPLGQRPLDLAADVVVSADTKALNGHSDVLFGHVSSSDAAITGAVRDWRRVAGAIPGPLRGLARASGAGDARGPAVAHVRERAAARRAPERASKGRRGQLPGTGLASGASAGARADDERRAPGRVDAARRRG